LWYHADTDTSSRDSTSKAHPPGHKPGVKTSPTFDQDSTSPTATVGRSEIDEQEGQSSKLAKFPDTAENSSVTPTNSKNQGYTPEAAGKKASVGDGAPQLHKWVYQTSQHDLTLAENLEKSKWESGCHEDRKRDAE
jgi:hypothetical protein